MTRKPTPISRPEPLTSPAAARRAIRRWPHASRVKLAFTLLLSLAVAAGIALSTPTAASAADPVPQTTGAQESTAAPAIAPSSFTFEDVVTTARELAAKPYHSGDTILHLDLLKNLSYDKFREIEFRRDKALWYNDHDILFKAQFFHRGSVYPNRVNISVVEKKDDRLQAVTVPFSADLFNYRALEPLLKGKLPSDLGFAGFRLLFPLNDPWRVDEILNFVGSSYFRVVGRGNTWGLSARGLAIDTSDFGHEEFPWFRHFWLVKPEPHARVMRVYALLDSQSLTGAYQFDIRPGKATIIDVHAALFPRRNIKEVGVAPLTSMYLYGENDLAARKGDFRPEVHDSDGLLILDGQDQAIWRPLCNPPKARLSVFPVEHPRGFGLFQRDRNFQNYQDLEAVYQKRPSVWVQPLTKPRADSSSRPVSAGGEDAPARWGKGEIRLIELPITDEGQDSIVAYWHPDAPVKAGHPLHLAYRLSFGSHPLSPPPLARVIATRTAARPDGTTRFVIEFSGACLDNLPEGQKVTAVVREGTQVKGQSRAVGAAQANASASQAVPENEIVVQRNPYADSWRVFFDAKAPAKLRAYLKVGDQTVSEIWSYQMQ